MRVPLLTTALAITMVGGNLWGSSALQTERANCQMAVDPSKPCHFSTGEAEYEVNHQGRIQKSIAGNTIMVAHLPLDDGLVVDTVLYMPYERDLILVCEVEDGESGAGLILRLDPKLAVKWRLKLPAFNLSVGALEDRFLYQAGIGTVAKVDLEKGVFAWKHEGLYDPKRRSFNSFHKPEVGPAEVLFQEELMPHAKGPARSIRVNKLTGRLQEE